VRRRPGIIVREEDGRGEYAREREKEKERERGERKDQGVRGHRGRRRETEGD